jgi:hypothetical protein
MSPRRAIPEKKKQSGLPSWLILAVIAAIAIAAVIVGADSLTKMTAPPAPSTGSGAASRTKGNPNAKVELVEWSDFQ